MPVADPSRPRTVIDTETTGLNVADGERMVSLGAVRGDLDGGPRAEQSWIIDTEGRQSAPDAFAIHRIATDHPDRVPERDAIIGLRAFVGDSIAVFQNAAFDMSFLNDACDRLKLPRFDFVIEDTILLGRERFPGRHVNLDALLKLLDIGANAMSRRRSERHTVLDDCHLTFEVWRRLALPSDLDLSSTAPLARAPVRGTVDTIPMEW